MEETPLITNIGPKRTETKPTIHVRVETETESGPLVLKISLRAAHRLRAVLKGLPPSIGPESPVTKLE